MRRGRKIGILAAVGLGFAAAALGAPAPERFPAAATPAETAMPAAEAIWRIAKEAYGASFETSGGEE